MVLLSETFVVACFVPTDFARIAVSVGTLLPQPVLDAMGFEHGGCDLCVSIESFMGSEGPAARGDGFGVSVCL